MRKKERKNVHVDVYCGKNTFEVVSIKQKKICQISALNGCF